MTTQCPYCNPNTSGKHDDNCPNIRQYNCRFHPYDWWHEIGCPHMEWTDKEKEESEKQWRKRNQREQEIFSQ